MSFNLAAILSETATASPEAPVSLAGGTVMTYRELDGQSGRFAASLRETGLLPGQVVGLQLPNMPQFLTAYFGALKAGLVVLPLNPLLMAPELEYHLTDSSAAILIGFGGLAAEASRACQRTGVPLYLIGGQDPLPDGARSAEELFSTALFSTALFSTALFSTAAGPAAGSDVEPRVADDTAVLIYNQRHHR